jgi:hypothetical protein
MDRSQELEEEVRRLSQTVEEMRSRMARIEGEPVEHKNGSEPRSRRGFLRMGLAAAAGAVGVTAAKILPAAAATGGNMILGQANQASTATSLATTVAANPTLGVQDVAFSSSGLNALLSPNTTNTFTAPVQALGATGQVEGIDAFAQGPLAYGVYGLTDAGTGVTGESFTGIGLYARTSGRLRQDPRGTAAAPTYTPNLYEQVRDSTGVLWIHNQAATTTAAGNWRRVNTLRTDTADGLGNAFKPLRLADTRNGTGGVTGPVGGGQTKVFTIAGAGAGASLIPADAVAVVGNITAVGWNQSGWLTIYPAGTAYNPNSDPSSMNFSGSAYAWANSFVVGLGTGSTWGGRVAVYVGTLGAGSTNFIIDITGYIQ